MVKPVSWRFKSMASKKVEDIVAQLAKKIVDKHSFELVDVEYVKEGGTWYLRVYIDKPHGITIDDCQVVSQELDKVLDQEDPIKQSYTLEVSSPGIDRPLKSDKDFERYKGRPVEIKLFQSIDGIKVFEGELQGLLNNSIIIKNDESQILEFEKDNVALVRRIIKF
jgi:ribosome maturation factor RimP